jgi:rubrerythrin
MAAREGKIMALDILKEKGVRLEDQQFDWRDLVRAPISKLNDDAFTRVRVILMNGLEVGATRFQHSFARMDGEMRIPLARIRRVEHFQQTLVNWLLPPDQSILETTIGYEQVAIEVTAHVAQNEPDPYLAQAYRFGLLEDFDHLYRFSALLDRLEGKDANTILQNYTDIRAGRPTREEHRAPEDDVRVPYDRKAADPLSKLHALTIAHAEHQTHDFYMNAGPMYADPAARMLYAEIAAIEEQHVTQYGSLQDPSESWLEKWLLHEAMEVYNYHSCMQSEENPRVKAIWERFTDYELGHLHFVMDLFRAREKRDPEEFLPRELPDPIKYEPHRDFVRDTLAAEADLRALGARFVPSREEGAASLEYRRRVNAHGSPSEIAADGYAWAPGTELRVSRAAMAPA